MTNPTYDRSGFGVQVRSTLIYERALELSHKLYWNSEDLGIARVHIYHDRVFKTRSALQSFCEQQGEAVPLQNFYFDWVDEIKLKRPGVSRQKYLRDLYWCKREQVINILLDTAMQAYRDDARALLSSLTGADFGNAELVKFHIKNQTRQYTGDPDSTFVDLKGKNIVLVEIKIGDGTTKYSLDQNVKYETMAALLRTDEFFPQFRVYKVLIGSQPKFSLNTNDANLLGPSSDTEGRLTFTYDAAALSTLKPTKNRDIHGLVAARLRVISKGRIDRTPMNTVDSNGILFYSWGEVVNRCSPGLLRDNLDALMKHLAPASAS